MTECTDRVIGKILAGWRYDISGLSPEMGADYEAHFEECAFCRSRRTIHRSIDIGLIILGTFSAALFLIAFAIVHHFEPKHAFILELIALGGFLLSALIWLIVAIATPAPQTALVVARTGVRLVHDKLPEPIREKIPEELRLKISGGH
jgi:hypothetical protein